MIKVCPSVVSMRIKNGTCETCNSAQKIAAITRAQMMTRLTRTQTPLPRPPPAPPPNNRGWCSAPPLPLPSPHTPPWKFRVFKQKGLVFVIL